MTAPAHPVLPARSREHYLHNALKHARRSGMGPSARESSMDRDAMSYDREGSVPNCRRAGCAGPHAWDELEAAGCGPDWAREISPYAVWPAAALALHCRVDPADCLALIRDRVHIEYAATRVLVAGAPEDRLAEAFRQAAALTGVPRIRRFAWAAASARHRLPVAPWHAAGALPRDPAAAGNGEGEALLTALDAAVLRMAEWHAAAGPDAPMWHAAGYSYGEAARLAALPTGHPDRPTGDDLAAMAGLAGHGGTDRLR